MNDEPAPPPAEAPGITWGVRASFVAYIRSLSDGAIDCSDGATMTADGSIRFPFAGTYDGAGEQWIHTRGAVRFEGHAGMLTVPLRNLALRVVPDAATLLTEQPDGSFFPVADVALGEPVTTGTALVWDAVPVVLGEAGGTYFGSQYPAGTSMAPLRVRVPLLG